MAVTKKQQITLAQQISQRNDIQHWLGVIKPQLQKLLKPYHSKVCVGNDETNPRNLIYENRSASQWPHQCQKKNRLA